MTDTKHYGVKYLIDTGDLLKQIKFQSYAPFVNLERGIVVDLGCGTGIDVVNLADLSGKDVHILGIDHDPLMIEQANINSNSRERVSFLVGEVYQLDFDDNSVAGIRMERVIQHLTQPNTMFNEVNRVLCIGAPLVIVETIWNSLNLYTDKVVIERKICEYLTGEKVKNGWAGNKLTSDLVQHGFNEVRLETFCMVVRSLEEANRFLFLDRILNEMGNIGILNNEEMTTFLDALIKADELGYFTCSMNLVIAKAIK